MIWLSIWFLLTIVYQSMGATFESRSTTTLSVDFELNLSPNSVTDLSEGGDINFWIKDAFIGDHDFQFASLVGEFNLSIAMVSVTNTVTLKSSYLLENFATEIYSSPTHRWINIQIFIKENSKMELFAWDYGNFSLEPKISQIVAVPTTFSNEKLIFKATGNSAGVYFSEIRVFKLKPNFCSGVFFRNYNIINQIPSDMIQYSRFSNGIFYIKSHLTTPESQNISSEVSPFEVNICEKGYKNSGSYGTCNPCSSSGCNYWEIVNSANSDLWRECNINITSCIESTVCPLDYFYEDGICKRWPVGCSEWINSTKCTYWDSGLSLTTQADSSIICKCPYGEYDTIDIATDVMTCAACDSSCEQWEITNTNCTSCTGLNFLKSNICIPECGLNMFENLNNHIWEDWGIDWENCLSPTNCTQCIVGMLIQDGGWVPMCSSNYLLQSGIWEKCIEGWILWDTLTTNCTEWESGLYLDSKLLKIIK